MIIDLDLLERLLSGIEISGALHIGAHECEELPFYQNRLKISDKKIIWIEAMFYKVNELINRNVPNVYNAVVTDKDDDTILFNIANNGQSSSVLEFETHSIEHPDVKMIDRIEKKTITVDTFFERNNLDASQCHFWNFDIQGAELLALKGATKSIVYAKAIYLEVNEKELYKGCGLIGDVDSFLLTHGFIRVATDISNHGWGDALYLNTKYINNYNRKYISNNITHFYRNDCNNVILFCPGGRESVLRIQIKYMLMLLELEIVYEYHIWDFSWSKSDSDFISTLGDLHPKIKIKHSPYKNAERAGQVASKQFSYFLHDYYNYETYKDYIFVKLDDDITYIDTYSFEKFIEGRRNSNSFLYSANIINNNGEEPHLFHSIHRDFINNHKAILKKNRCKQISKFSNENRLSINFVSFLGEDLKYINKEFSNGVGSNDEWRLCHVIPKMLDRQNEICLFMSVVHYAYGGYIDNIYLNHYLEIYEKQKNKININANFTNECKEMFYNYFKNDLNVIFDVGSKEESIYSKFEGDVHYFEPNINLLDKLKDIGKKNRMSVYNNFMLSHEHNGNAYMNKYNITNIELLNINDCVNTLNILNSFREQLKNIKLIQFEWFDNDSLNIMKVVDYLISYGFCNFSYLSINGPIQINNFSNNFEMCTIVCINSYYNGAVKLFNNEDHQISGDNSYESVNISENDSIKKIAFYTCFFGDDSNVSNVISPVPSEKYDCYYFTNNINTYNKLIDTKWKRILIAIPIKQSYNLNSMDSKELKACPNHYEILNDYDYTCYFDSKLYIEAHSVEKLIETELSNSQSVMILAKHGYLALNNWKPSVWYEFNECLHQERYYIEKDRYFNYIQKQLDKGLVDTNNTHYSTHFIIRKNSTLTNQINELWYEHIKECGIECQISFFFINQLYVDYIKSIESYQCYKGLI